MTNRFPRTFWLLLIATMVINIAATVWLFRSERLAGSNGDLDNPALKYALPVWSALAFGQLSVLAIWTVMRSRYDVWSWILPAASLFAVSAIRRYLNIWSEEWKTIDYASRSALQMLAPVIVLWVLIRTPGWQRTTRNPVLRKWEFSLLQILAWTTAVAVISTIIVRSSRLPNGLPMALGASHGIIAPAALAVVVAVLSQLRMHWIARLIGCLLAGVAAGVYMVECSHLQWAIFHTGTGQYQWMWPAINRLLLEFTLEALVIAAWLEWGGLFHREESRVSEAA